MILTIPELLTPQQVEQCRAALQQADWQDGRATAGHLALRSKHNRQLAENDPVAERIGQLILERLGNNARFLAAALPLKVLPPRFNHYAEGGSYGDHIDNAVFSVPGTPHRVRSDLSATLFFSDPDEYEGGELIIQDIAGDRRIKLPAGHMVLYPGYSVHRVAPVTRGVRLASFFWIQSLVRDVARRQVLLELDTAIQGLTADLPGHVGLTQLTGVYHNLLRLWSET